MKNKYIRLTSIIDEVPIGTIAKILGRLYTKGLWVKLVKPPYTCIYTEIGISCKPLDSFEVAILEKTLKDNKCI